MTDSESTYRTREHRFVVQEDKPLHAELERESADEKIVCTIGNLSLGGAKLIVPEPLTFSETVILRLHIPEADVDATVQCRICWARPSGNGWSVGCAFSRRLTPDLLDQLSSLGYLERRNHGRQEVDIQATAKWELNDEKVPVRLRNFSTGGFAMESAQRTYADQQVLLEIPTGDKTQTLSARVVWQSCAGEGYLVGCAFVGPGDAEKMRRAVAILQPDVLGPAPATPTQPVRNRLMAAGFVTAAILGWMAPRWDDLRPAQAAPLPTSRSEDGASNDVSNKERSDRVRWTDIRINDSTSRFVQADPSDQHAAVESGLPVSTGAPNVDLAIGRDDSDSDRELVALHGIPGAKLPEGSQVIQVDSDSHDGIGGAGEVEDDLGIAIRSEGEPSLDDIPLDDSANGNGQIPRESTPLARDVARDKLPTDQQAEMPDREPTRSIAPPSQDDGVSDRPMFQEGIGVSDAPESEASTAADTLAQQAIVAVQEEDHARAMELLRDAIKVSPRDPAYRYFMAAVARTANHGRFARTQAELGWTLEQRYQVTDPIRLADQLPESMRQWVYLVREKFDRDSPAGL